jgi:uncharacterized OB-fold protein
VSERPLPVPTEDSRSYWEAAAEGRLLLQRCQACGSTQFYPRAVCVRCLCDDLQWTESEGRGSIYSFSRVEMAPSEAFAADVPYVVALVRLDDGVQMLTRIVGCAPDAVEIGLRVRADFERMADGVALPVFRPERNPR